MSVSGAQFHGHCKSKPLIEVHHAEHVCMSVSLELMFFCTWDGTWCYVLDDMRNQDPESDCIKFQDYYHLVQVIWACVCTG